MTDPSPLEARLTEVNVAGGIEDAANAVYVDGDPWAGPLSHEPPPAEGRTSR